MGKIKTIPGKWFVLAGFVSLLWVLALFFAGTNYARVTESYLASEIEAFHHHTKAVLDTYALFAQYIFTQAVDVPHVQELMYGAFGAPPGEQADYREQLYAELETTYQSITGYNFRQLHFHFPDGTSFLRFHAPDIFGDSLMEIRDSIRIANTDLRKVQGFEEGRIYNGYRYVFPLFHGDIHVGSVEVSTSLASMIEILTELNPRKSIFFLLSRSIVEGLVFQEFQKNYSVTRLSPEFVFDNQVHAISLRECECGFLDFLDIDEMFAQAGKEIQGSLETLQNQSHVFTFGGVRYLLQFILLTNITDQPVGYFFTISEDRVYTLLRASIFVQSLLITLVFILFLLFSFFVLRSREKLIQAVFQAEEASKAKSQFLANMSHEIRTPLNGMLGFTEMLKMTNLDPLQTQYAENAYTSGKLLYEIINEILDFSKIEAGRLELELIPVDLAKLVRETGEILRYQANEKGLSLMVEIEPGIHPFVTADPTRIKQILVNLLSNAVKFTQSGQIILGLASAPGIEGTELYRFRVTDTGMGIDREVQELLFVPFYQADSSTTRKFGGTGLGLVICQLLLKKMNSTLGVQSKPGKGSTFAFQLELPKVPEYQVLARRGSERNTFSPDQNQKEQNQTEQNQTEESGTTREGNYQEPAMGSTDQSSSHGIMSGCRILIAEDVKMNALLLKSFLTTLLKEPDLSFAENGKIAVNLAREQEFHIIFMDVQMPEVDGIEATKEIRQIQKEQGLHTPIIALTAGVIKEERDACIEAGMDGFIGKPVSMEVLKNALKEFCSYGKDER